MRSAAPPLRIAGWLCLALCAGCQPHAQPERSEAPLSKTGKNESVPPQTYRLVGVVREVDREAGKVAIAHEAIPGYMPAMTMWFPLKDSELLDDVQLGDEVEGTLRVGDSASELVGLSVTRPAPAAPLTLDLSDGTAQLKTQPALLEPGQAVPDFTMTTQEGKTLRLSDLRGDVVVLTFIYTRCPLPDFCPLIDRKFSELAGKIGAVPAWAKQVRLLSVSFDPEYDTPEVLSRHARSLSASPPLWTFAVAPHDELRKVAGPLGLSYGPMEKEIIHTLSTAIIDPEGNLVRLEKGKKWDITDFFKTIYRLLPRSRQ